MRDYATQMHSAHTALIAGLHAAVLLATAGCGDNAATPGSGAPPSDAAVDVVMVEGAVDGGRRDGSPSPRDASGGPDASAAFGKKTVFVSAGAGDSCWRYETSGCSVHELSVDLSTRESRVVGAVRDTGGAFNLAVSSDGQRLAFDRATGNSVKSHVRDLKSGVELTFEAGSNKPQWLASDQLAFGAQNLSDPSTPKESFRWSDIGVQSVPDTSNAGTSPKPGDAIRVLGARNATTSFTSYDCSGEDPYPVPGRPGWLAAHSAVWRFETRPTSGSPLAHTCPWLVGLDPYTDAKDPRPVVFDVSATRWAKGATYEAVDTSSAGITGCAHVSVAPSGDVLMCTNQPGVRTIADRVDGTSTEPNEMFGFRRTDQGWTSVRPGLALFDHANPRDLPDASAIWVGNRSCHVYRTKQGSFCGDNNVIASDVYCEDTSQDPRNPMRVFARAMLIDISDPTRPIYTDLTSLLEDATNAPRGSMGSFTLTCASQ